MQVVCGRGMLNVQRRAVDFLCALNCDVLVL